MNVRVEDISSVKKKLFFEVPADKVDAAFGSAYKSIGRTAKIPGFRPGKIPRHVLQRHYGGQAQAQVFEQLVSETYFRALTDNKIDAVSNPEIIDNSPLEAGKVFTYEAEVDVRPQIEAKDYLELQLKKEKLTVDEKMIDDRIEEMRKGSGCIEVSEHEEARMGDLLIIDFEGFIDGKAFERGSAEDHTLELGSNTFIPGFEEQLVGMKRGDERDVEVTFPENYGNKELAGKPALFKVVLKEIKERISPELNDEFAKEMGLASLEDLRGKIAETFEAQETERIQKDFREGMVSALVERNPMELPESMIDSQLDYMLQNLQNRLQSQGMKLSDMGLEADGFKKVYRELAIRQIKASLIFEAVALQENIKVDEGDIKEKLDEIIEGSGAPKEAVVQYYADENRRRELVSQLAEEKVVAFLTGKATVEMVDKAELEGANAEEE
jgi:trigger factor